MTCKDCIHCEACERMISDTSKMFKALLSEILKMNCDIKYDSTNILSGAEICQCFQDRSRFVELPCKVGDLIYIIKKARGFSVRGAKVNSITITESGKIQVSCYRSSFIGFWSDDAFATKEEAEQALKEREKDE